MASASQRHKLAIRGYDSSGGRQALYYIKSQSGTDTVPAIIVLEGKWSSTDDVTVTLNIGGGDLTPNYSPSGDEDAEAAATGLAAQVNGETGVTASASANQVIVTKTTSGSVVLSSIAPT